MTAESPTNATSSPMQADRSRVPYVTAYMGLYAVISLISLPIALMMLPLPISVTRTLLFRLVVLIGGFIVVYFVFRWAVQKHIVPYVSVTTPTLQDYGNRISLKNPYLMGVVGYFVLYALAQVCIGPLKDGLLSPATAAPSFLIDFILDGLVGFFPFAIAVKYVTLKPYRLRRLLPFLGLSVLLTFSLAFAIGLVQVRQEWAFRNHVYCGLLQQGMRKGEVETALKPIGLRYQADWGLEELKGPPIARAATFTTPGFDTPEVEYGLRLVLGYDSEQRLVMVGQRGFLSRNYEPVECPLPFR